MNKTVVLKGLVLIIIITLFNILFTIGGINAFSDENTESANRYHSRRITNDYSNLPQFAKMDEEITRFMERWSLVGASVAIVNQGKLAYAKGFGWADREREVHVQPEHLFRVASISKLITAVAIMKLKEYGQLSLEDRVFGKEGILNDSIYLDYRDYHVEQITVRHLLEHSGGWSTRYGDPMFMNAQIANIMDEELPISKETILQYVLKKHRLSFQPGSRSYYSNVGYVALGEVIEKVSGMPYEDFVKSNILKPLGIHHMKLGRNLLDQRDISEVVYYDREGATHRLSCTGSGEMVPRPYGGTDVESLGSAGGWIASSIELMKLMVSIDGYTDVPDYLSPNSIEEMTCPRDPILSPLGWRDVNDKGVWWRTGTLAGSSALAVRQNDGISWVVILNSSTWKGARFTKDIYRMMSNAIGSVEEWPEQDLFNLHFPPSIEPISPFWWTSSLYNY